MTGAPDIAKHAIFTWKFPGGQHPSRMAFLEVSRKDDPDPPTRKEAGHLHPSWKFPGMCEIPNPRKSERIRDDIRPVEQQTSRKLPGSVLKTASFQQTSRKDPVFRSPKNHRTTLFCRNGLRHPGNFLEGSRMFPGTFQEGSRKTR